MYKNSLFFYYCVKNYKQKQWRTQYKNNQSPECILIPINTYLSVKGIINDITDNKSKYPKLGYNIPTHNNTSATK